MIITRTPLRISFSGGGSDIPVYFKKNGGAVISTSINKYIYTEIHPFFDPGRIQLKYSQTENVDTSSQIKHRIFRRVLEKYNLSGVELTTTADIPTGTGMGSSSSFTVGLLQSVHAYQGRFRSKEQLANEACQIEIEDLGAPIGKQDQYASALGGLNYIQFNRDGTVEAFPVLISREKSMELNQNLLLFYTGTNRDANKVLHNQVENLKKDERKSQDLGQIVDIAGEMRAVLENGDLPTFGKLLNEAWQLKRTLSTEISNSRIDDIYQLAMDSGATGGKLLGAGSGGFILFYCEPEKQRKLREELHFLRSLPFYFDGGGVQVIYYNT